MQRTIFLTLFVLCLISTAMADKPKHDQIVAEFPGHKYAVEVAVEEVKETVDGEETTVQTVFAHLTDAHFKPIRADVKEVRLNFVVDKKPKSFVLPQVKKDTGPSVFELKDPELIVLISAGWKGNASISMRVGKTPYSAKLIKAKDFKPHAH